MSAFDDLLDGTIEATETAPRTIEHVEGYRFHCENCGWLGAVKDHYLAVIDARLHWKVCEA